MFQDNSFSIVANRDSSFYKSDYIDLINEFKSNIEKNLMLSFYYLEKILGKIQFLLMINFLILVQFLIILKMFFQMLILVHIYYFQTGYLIRDKTQII